MPIDVKNMTSTKFTVIKERYESLRKFFYNELDIKSQEYPIEYEAIKTALYDMKKIVDAAEREQITKKTGMFLKSIEEYTGKSADQYLVEAMKLRCSDEF